MPKRSANRRLVVSVIVFVVAVSVGVAGYMAAGWTMMDAMYMVIITIFGVGYGEVKTMSPELRIFTIIFIIVGCTSLLYVAGSFINWLTEGQLQQYLGKRKMEKEIRNLKEHVIICGFGRIGMILAAQLHKAKKPFLIIEKSEDKVREIQEMGYLAIIGDATEEVVLKRARIEDASIMATVLPEDAANVFIVLSCRSLNHKLTIIARSNQISTVDKLKQAGADKVVMPAAIGADRLANLILKPNAEEILQKDLHDNTFIEGLNDIGLAIGEIYINEQSQVAGGTLEDLETKGKSAFLVVAVRKSNGETIVKPKLSTRLQAGDALIVISQKDVSLEFMR